MLLKSNYHVEVLDINGYRYSEEEVEIKLKKYLDSCEIMGIGCLITCYDYVKRLIKTIKEIKPQTKIILGGAWAVLFLNCHLRN